MSIFKSMKQKVAAFGALLGFFVAMMIPGFAQAALDTAVTDLITSIVTDVGLLFTAVLAIWAAVRGPSAILRLGNKFISKAGA